MLLRRKFMSEMRCSISIHYVNVRQARNIEPMRGPVPVVEALPGQRPQASVSAQR
jgi:hypothetical protein